MSSVQLEQSRGVALPSIKRVPFDMFALWWEFARWSGVLSGQDDALSGLDHIVVGIALQVEDVLSGFKVKFASHAFSAMQGRLLGGGIREAFGGGEERGEEGGLRGCRVERMRRREDEMRGDDGKGRGNSEEKS